MFGATAVRRKREREQREKAARGFEPEVFPYIKPFGKRFDRNQLPYFKYRQNYKSGVHLHQAAWKVRPE